MIKRRTTLLLAVALACTALACVLFWGPTAQPGELSFTTSESSVPVSPSRIASGVVQPVPAASSSPAARSENKDPSWLWSLPASDRNPRSVYDAWAQYSKSQGNSLDAAKELIRFAQTSPFRHKHGESDTVDEWIGVFAQSKDPAVVDAVFSMGYLTPALNNALSSADARADLAAITHCKQSACIGLRSLFVLDELPAYIAIGWLSDVSSRCQLSMADPLVAARLTREVDSLMPLLKGISDKPYVQMQKDLYGKPCEVVRAALSSGS